ncbi:DDE-type integrase/transposase/recombinase [Leptothoe sp. LEGE 181152]|nr:DDE-type integrase/transposase/recombinase [Leptothoe sp. LEGE 181152]
MVDAYSRRLLAVYITYEEPSYRSCMMALRICVKRFNRFPQTIVVDNGKEFHSHYFEQLLAYYSCTQKYRPPAQARFGSVVERLFGTANSQLIYELQGNTQIMKNVRQVTKSVAPAKLATWTIGDLYQALCEWAYEIYDQREHSALGTSPRSLYQSGLAIGGNRTHISVLYNESFHVLTLPAPERGKRKVQPSHGVKINNIYYWCNAFRDPEIEKTMVDVKYDPFDASVAYAYVQGQWVECVSNYTQYFKGRTEKEIRLLTADLNRRKKLDVNKTTTTEKELVRFLNSVEAKEGKLLQKRLQALEDKTVFQVVEGNELIRNDHTVHLEQAVQTVDIQNEQSENLKNDFSVEELEYYGEF